MLENFTPVDQLAEMRCQAVTLVDDFDPETVSVFSTKNQVCMHCTPVHAIKPLHLSFSLLHADKDVK